ncbi:hydrogenase/urease nickel incorporation protein HypA [Helicobacter sp. MIT 05-5294]|uniref:hydrogenase/urease nickel incorporation protein HypA n=1 Tax=Helicobacter sp. MIT 05-5294 TaxID=1548150 RepID=UPI00051FD3C2|nr:hydrogenase/urease nickel incorporation protein HypA [Helicobacter sp. MIT 05-5294]TLD87493.1 hydrogenase/urease nickel incorporation protein HypA [Helicobacter sp. MIT 05-5294]
MHEFSIVSSLLESCEEIAQQNKAQKILTITLDIGERSGVNVALLKSAFEEFKCGSICEDSKLLIQESKVELTCEQCHQTSIPKELNYTRCPQCGSDQVKITKGNEMLLLRLEME